MASPESVINGRFKLLNRPAVLPGKCGVCGSVERPVVDFGMDVDYYGTVYFCVDCLREAASVAGILGDSSVTQAAPLPIDYEGLNEYFRATSNALDRINLIVPDYVVSLVVNQADTSGADESSGGTIPEPQESNEPQSQPTVSEGPNDSPSLSSSALPDF